ncbi:MAG: glycerol-3-phosphate 1-O-acyltransferase PlsY [Luteolibacter sp.]
MQLWLCPLIAFLLGSIPFGLLIAKAKGIDIRQHGSGNIGATNVLRVVGKKYGITCLFLDALKGLIPTLLGITLIRYAGASEAMTIKPLLSKAIEVVQWKAQLFQVITGLFAILGHNYSPWVGFKGGKGIATSAGVLIALMPAGVVILIVVWLLLFLTTRYVSVASIGAAALLPVIMITGSAVHGKLANGTWNKPLFAFSVVIAVLAIWKHRANIQRLRNGTENRFQPKSKRNA